MFEKTKNSLSDDQSLIKDDQIILNEIIKKNFYKDRRIGLLDNLLFPNELIYFNEKLNELK